MAKVTAPLFSFTARGQLAKSLVYMTWRGINDVRSYVVPANPNTAAQQTQRGRMRDSIEEWHAAPFVAGDLTAWNKAASIAPTPMAGFNSFVQKVIALLKAGITQANLAMGYAGALSQGAAGKFNATVTEEGTAIAADLLWGYSPTALIYTQALGEVANVWTATDVVAAVGATVYGRFKMKGAAAAEVGNTGIYKFGPLA